LKRLDTFLSNEEYEMSLMIEQPQSYTWSQTWKKVVSDPSKELFQAIMSDPQASLIRAITWVFLGGMGIATIFFILPILVLASLADRLGTMTAILFLVAGPLIGGLLISLVFLGNVITIHWLSRLTGGEGSFEKTAYVLASIVTPFSLINIILLLVPVLGWVLIYVMGVYQLIVTILAIQALYEFGWGQAILIGIIPPALLNILVTVAYYAIVLALLFALAENPDAFFPPTATP
jgi:hypothetical protein